MGAPRFGQRLFAILFQIGVIFAESRAGTALFRPLTLLQRY
jgi:hypothetical protein